ncbi:MAG TPA: HEAT repeat domain-containing protein [Candidatus Acidoferrales bacterium]|jgi:hypothetical protein|nr:HEAT repeat domain-containing protein [Candidatus Acidoferrales bacterium]
MPSSKRSSSKLLLPFVAFLVLAAAQFSSYAGQDSATKPAAASTTSQQEKSSAANNSKAADAKSPKPGPADAWKMLSDAAASDKMRDRSDAISALTILPRDRKAVDIVASALDDKQETIRMLAATSLGDMKAPSAIPKLKQALDDKYPQVSFAAAQALWKMGDKSGRGIFYDVLIGERKVKPGPIQQKIQQARLDMHDPKALALIGVNEASGAFLGPFSMGVSMVEEYAKNGGTSVQALCAQLLATDDSGMTVEQLKWALDDSNWTVRAAAARSLAKLNVRSSLPKLEDIMQNDKSQPARLAAAAAVIHLSGTRAVSARSGPEKTSPKEAPGPRDNETKALTN